MSFATDFQFFFLFIFENIYNFFRWTPFGPKKCKIDGRLDGKTVVITGTTSGIGKATAKILASKGISIFLL
jgi:NADPH:quinone reductase-like Zn-dependent oxidoreductase